MANTVPYIGSRMSLISKADIRYEGFLHEIDTQNTTVTLKNVRSFGTENRKIDKIIPPKDDVFQYIIFRGSDIKDISVCESAPFIDPAILQSGPPASGAPRTLQTQSTSQAAPGASSSITPDAVSPTPTSFTAFGMPTGTSQAKSYPPTVPSPQAMFPQTSTTVQEAPQLSPEPLIESRQNVSEQNSGRPSNNQGRQNFNQKGRGFGGDRGDRSFSATTRQNQYNRNYQQDYARPYSYNTSVGPYTNNYNNSGGYRMNPGGGSQMLGQGGNRQNNRNYNYQGGPSWWNQGMNNRRGGPGGGGPRNRGYDNNGGDLKIEEEFDIDKANKQFEDDKKKMREIQEGAEDAVHNLEDVEEGEVAADDSASKFYDKSKSFFDSISCDSMEKKNNRLTTAEEKRLNAQTFGVPHVMRNRGGGGGPGNSNGGYRPRSYNDHHSGGGGQGGGNNYRREYSSNFYGGFGNTSGGGGGNFSRRGPGANSYYTSNYSGGGGNSVGGAGGQGTQRQNYRQNNSSSNASNNRISQPAQA